MPQARSTAGLEAALDGRQVCVTGGAGFIGSHLCEALAAAGAEVQAIDDLSAGRRENLAAVAGRVHLVEGSIMDPPALAAALEGAEIVFHLAAIASVPRSLEHPARYVQVNTMGTLRVLEAARAAGARRLVFASSSSVYGDQPGQPRVETMAPDPRSPYSASKGAAEQLVRAHAHCFGLTAVSLRYFNIFGPRQRADSSYAAVIPRFTEALRRGEKPVVYGDGRQSRDFTHVSNAVRANLLAAVAPGPLRGEVLNVACGRETTVLDLLDRIAEILGTDRTCTHAPERRGEVHRSMASIATAGAVIGYAPITGLEEGLRGTVGQDRSRPG